VVKMRCFVEGTLGGMLNVAEGNAECFIQGIQFSWRKLKAWLQNSL